MDVAPDNPNTNAVGFGITDKQIVDAIEQSGYPLQTVIGDILRNRFGVQDEWSYVDRDTRELRTIDLHAEKRLHGWDPQPRVRPQLHLLLECKQSQLPYVFFESRPSLMLDHPKVYGLRLPTITFTSDDDASSWSYSVIHALDLQEESFQTTPSFSATFSKCVRKGADLTLSGADAYNGLVLPLIKSVEHFGNANRPPPTAWYFDADLTVALAVLDAPMVLARVSEGQTTTVLTPWVRVLRHEYDETDDRWNRDRVWAIDVVHRDYVATYLDAHLLPFAQRFAERVLRHPIELATGQAFATKMGADSWSKLESRMKPRRVAARVKRSTTVVKNIGRLLWGVRGDRQKGEIAEGD